MTSSHDSVAHGTVLTAELAQRYLEDFYAVDASRIESIDGDAAEILSRSRTSHPDAYWIHGLHLPFVRSLSDRTAIALSHLRSVMLTAVTTLEHLSEEAVRALGTSGCGLYFDGLTAISPAHLRLLVLGNGALSLNGLSALSDEHLTALATHTGDLSLDGIRQLTAEQARLLLCSTDTERAGISLDGLAEIDEDTATILGRTRRMNVSLGGLTHLSPRAAAHLARAQGELDLGVGSLPTDVARALAAHIGKLRLDGFPTLSDAAAVELSHHRGSLMLFGDTEGQEKRPIADGTLRLLSSHHGELGITAITAPSPASLAEVLARRSTLTERGDASSDDDFVWLGEDGEFSDHMIRIRGLEARNNMFALAHHLQTGAVTTLTPRELLGWFGAQRRGKKVVDRIHATISAFRQEGFDGLGAIATLLEADDLDLVHVFPPTAPVTGSFADALRAPMTRMGYHIVDGNDDAVRFQTVFATGRRRMLTITRIASAPLILRAEVSIALPDDAATVALAITTAHRLNRLSFVGRYRVDLIARTFHFDVTGAVRILSDLRTADEPTGVLPRLLSYVEAADLMMHRLLLDEPVHDPPERSIEGIDHAEAGAELTGVAIEGPSLRVTTAIVLGPRPFNPEEGDEEPPRVVPETIGIVTRANTSAECAKIYLTRDVSEIESVFCELAIIVTDDALLAAVAEWMNEHVQRLRTSLREHLIEKGALQRITTVDEILASLDRAAPISAEAAEREGDTPEETAIRQLLFQADAIAVRQGLALATDHGDPDIWSHLLDEDGIDPERTTLDADGRIVLAASCAIEKFVDGQFREEVALTALRHTGALDEVRSLTLSSASTHQLHALRGLDQLTTLHLSSHEALDLQGLAAISSLESLALNELQPLPDLAVLGEHPSLRTLHLNNIELGAHQIRSFRFVESLSISATSLSTDHLNALSSLPSLRILRLSFIDALQDLGSLANASALEVLHLGYCDELGDLSALEKLPKLRELQVQCCRRIASIDELRGQFSRQLIKPGIQAFLHDMSHGGPLYQLLFDEAWIRRAFNRRVLRFSKVRQQADRSGVSHLLEHPARILLLHAEDSFAVSAVLETLPEIDSPNHPSDGLDFVIVDPSDGIVVGLGLKDDQYSFKEMLGDVSPERLAKSVVSCLIDQAEDSLDSYGYHWRASGESSDDDEIEEADEGMDDATSFFEQYFPSMDRLANNPDQY